MPRQDQPDPVLVELRHRWGLAQGRGPVAEVEFLLSASELNANAGSTMRRLDDLLLRFAHRLATTGVATLAEVTGEDCESFLWTPTRRNQAASMHTVHLRRTALRGLFRTLRHLDPEAHDPTAALDLPAKPDRLVRPLTTNELNLVRISALGRVRRPARAASLVALAEATATTGELPRLTWCDVDLDTATVALPGAAPIDRRTGSLTTWGAGVLRRWKRETPHPAGTPIAGPRSTGDTDYAAQAAMSSALSRLIDSAGVTSPNVRPSSIRLWGGRRILSTSGIEAAARSLGLDSLDATAAALGHNWEDKS